MPRRKCKVTMNIAVREFMYDKICEGYHVSEICKLYPDKVPTESGFHKYCALHPQYRAQIREAYTILFTRKIDEYDGLSKSLYKSKSDDRWEIKRIEVRLKTLEYQLKVIAPIIADYFTPPKQTVSVEHSGTVNKTITVLDYSKVDTVKALSDARGLLIEHVSDVKVDE